MIKAILENPHVMGPLVDLLALALTALVSVATAALFRWLKAHGIAVSVEEAKLVDIISTQGAAYAEEWGRSLALGGASPSGAEKARVAMNAARQLAAGRLTKAIEAKLAVAIPASLPALRAQSMPPAAPVARFGEVQLDLPEREP